MVETPENKDIQPPKSSQQTESKEDINFLIEKKCKEIWFDNIKTDKINTFFNSIKKDLPEIYQENLQKYIEKLGKSDFIKIAILNWPKIDSEKKKILDQINKLSEESIITTYNEVKNKENEVKNKESKDQEMIKALDEARSSFKAIPASDKTELDLNKQDDKTQNEIRQKVAKINENVQDPEQKISENEFFNMQLTSQNLRWKPEYQDFITKFDRLDKLAWPTRSFTPKILSWKTAITETNTLIESNENLNQYSQWIDTGNTTSTQEYQKEKETITKLEDPEEINQKFKENQNLIEKYTKILPEKPEEDENKTKEQNEQQLLQWKKNTLLQINDLEQQTQTILQKRILWSAISGLAGYFDFSTAEKENIENDFITNNMTIDQNIFSLKGNVNGKNINVNYNLQNGNLAMEDHLFQEKDQKVIRIGENKFQNLNILLPSLAILRDNAQTFLTQDISGDNPNEYLKNLENGLHQELTSNFKGNQEIIKVRLERATQKNLAVQETLKNFNKILTPEEKDLFTNKDFWEETTEKNLFKLLQTVDNSLENYSISDIEERRKNMNILTNFIETSLNDQTPNNKMKEVFKKNLSNQNEKNNYENQTSKTEYLYKVINSFCTTKNTKEIVSLENFKKLTDQLRMATPDTNKLWEKTSKLFEPTEENPDLLLAKWPD